MGHCDSSAAFSGTGPVRGVGKGTVEPPARHEAIEPAPAATEPSLAARLLLSFIRAYQILLSPLAPSPCKFYPTCSHYGAEAIRVHGARRGAWLALKRLIRCNPFTPGGFDPVPEADSALRSVGARS